MGAVLQFPVAVVSTFPDAWKLLPDTMRKRSESRAKVEKLWRMHADRLGGQDVLLGALRAYLKGDKDLPKSGGPGLQVWLRAEKYDHWLAEGESSVDGLMKRDPALCFPEPFRAHLVALCGEGWVVSYVDSCTLDATTIIVPKGKRTAWSKLDEKRNAMREAGLTARRWSE